MGRPDRPPPFRRVTSSRKSLPFNHGAGHSADGHGGARGVGILGCHEGTLGPKASTRSKRRKPLVRVGVWLGVVLLTDSDSASVCNRSIASLPVALDTKREAAGRAGDFVRRQRSGFKTAFSHASPPPPPAGRSEPLLRKMGRFGATFEWHRPSRVGPGPAHFFRLGKLHRLVCRMPVPGRGTDQTQQP